MSTFSSVRKIILSRKGFDSAFGGYPSPVLGDGRLISLPIPEKGGTLYSSIQCDGRTSYAQVMEQRGIRTVRYGDGHRDPLGEARAHVDPDIVESSLARRRGWRPMFGQDGAAQKHLANWGVGVGDLFLFFGWFRKAGVDLHVIWGYLEVGEVIEVANCPQPPVWAAAHPHFVRREEYRKRGDCNTVYVGAERLCFRREFPGAGLLGRYRPELRLTAPESTKRSLWSLPVCFHPSQTPALPMTYHGEKSWRGEDLPRLQSAARGQEFVVEVNEGIREWIEAVFDGVS